MVIMTSSHPSVPAARPPAREVGAARRVAALAVLVSAVVHLALWADGYREIPVVGPLFLLQAVAGVVLAVLLAAWVHRLPALGAVGYGVATLGAYLLSLSVGFFGVREHVVTTEAVVAGVAELVAAVAGAVVLVRDRRA
jgi:hypothetical protein